MDDVTRRMIEDQINEMQENLTRMKRMLGDADDPPRTPAPGQGRLMEDAMDAHATREPRMLRVGIVEG